MASFSSALTLSNASPIDSETNPDSVSHPGPINVAVSSSSGYSPDLNCNPSFRIHSEENVENQAYPAASDVKDAALIGLLKSLLKSDKDNTEHGEESLSRSKFKSGAHESQNLRNRRLVDARLRPSGIQGLIFNSSASVLRDGGSRSSKKLKSCFFRFLDLPKELILDISELCEFETLHALTATSHLINSIVFPSFLAASGLNLPSDESAVYFQDSYGVLHIKTPEQALALFVWKRHSSFHRIKVLNFMLELAANQSAIVVDHSLSFFKAPMPFNQPFANMINVYVSSAENVELEATRLIYGLQYSRCKRLSITGLTRISLPNPALYFLPLIEPTNTGYNGLEVFHACGSFPFLPHFLPFTMHNILTSNLRELEINLNGFCIMRWSIILRDLYLPNLEKFNFGGAIAVITILRFLRRHRKLRSLSLCGITTSFVRPDLPRRFLISFTDLEYIRAPSLYLCEILRYIRRSTASISRITILTDFYKPFSFGNSAVFRRSSVTSLLKQVMRFPSIKNLEFYFSRSSSMEFCKISQEAAEVPPETLLYSVNTISLHKNIGTPFDNKELEKITDWISLFPNVSCVELWESSYNDRTGWMSALCSKGITPYHHF